MTTYDKALAIVKRNKRLLKAVKIIELKTEDRMPNDFILLQLKFDDENSSKITKAIKEFNRSEEMIEALGVVPDFSSSIQIQLNIPKE